MKRPDGGQPKELSLERKRALIRSLVEQVARGEETEAPEGDGATPRFRVIPGGASNGRLTELADGDEPEDNSNIIPFPTPRRE